MIAPMMEPMMPDRVEVGRARRRWYWIRFHRNPPRNEPTMPSRIVPKSPIGSRPGTSSRATAPAMSPTTMQDHDDVGQPWPATSHQNFVRRLCDRSARRRDPVAGPAALGCNATLGPSHATTPVHPGRQRAKGPPAGLRDRRSAFRSGPARPCAEADAGFHSRSGQPSVLSVVYAFARDAVDPVRQGRGGRDRAARRLRPGLAGHARSACLDLPCRVPAGHGR